MTTKRQERGKGGPTRERVLITIVVLFGAFIVTLIHWCTEITDNISKVYWQNKTLSLRKERVRGDTS